MLFHHWLGIIEFTRIALAFGVPKRKKWRPCPGRPAATEVPRGVTGRPNCWLRGLSSSGERALVHFDDRAFECGGPGPEGQARRREHRRSGRKANVVYVMGRLREDSAEGPAV